MEKAFIEAEIQKAGDKITFVASDETLDRAGEIIPIDSWDLKHFKKNPVLLVDHDYRVENIVGLARNIRTEGKKLLFDPVFHGLTDLSNTVKTMVENKILTKVSVGFMPRRKESKDKKEEKATNELLEVSFVAVPANPNATMLSAVMAKSADRIAKKDDIKAWLLEKQTEVSEVQSLVLSKTEFKDEETAVKWIREHDFKANDMEETGKAFVFKQFDDSKCLEGDIKTIEMTDGVEAKICRLKKDAGNMVMKITIEDSQVKLTLNDGVVMEFAADKQALDLFSKSTAPVVKPIEERDSDKKSKPKPVRTRPSALVRTLQAINKLSNQQLRELKDK